MCSIYLPKSSDVCVKKLVFHFFVVVKGRVNPQRLPVDTAQEGTAQCREWPPLIQTGGLYHSLGLEASNGHLQGNACAKCWPRQLSANTSVSSSHQRGET